MVSCQWRLTSGARAGQACGKGKAVFCKTHAPMAERELKNIFGNWRNNPATEYLSWQDKEAKRLLFPPKRANSNYQYRRSISIGANDFSKSWIWDSETNQLNNKYSYPSVWLIDEICYPQTVANWLEDVYSTSLVRGGQIFPQPITSEQLNAIGNLAVIFQRRMSSGERIREFYTLETQDSRRGRPLPFFQNRNYWDQTYSIYNMGFSRWMQRCINYSPDYTALWNWFLPEFTNNMAERLDAIQRGYDVDAIQQDLKALRKAYAEGLREQNIPTQIPANRYRNK
jgi:hypothetical protein